MDDALITTYHGWYLITQRLNEEEVIKVILRSLRKDRLIKGW